MPASMATKLGIQFARFAQYTAASVNNAGTHGLRGAFANASSGPPPAFAPGLSSTGSASAHSTGIGGAKFQAGKGAHSSFQNSGRTLANANASSASDGNTSLTDDDDELATISAHGPAQIHRPFFQERRESIFQQGLRNRLIEHTSTLHLIMPTSPGRHISGARSISSSASQESQALISPTLKSSVEQEELFSRPRSLSTSASQAQETLTSEHSFGSQPPPPPPEVILSQSQSDVEMRSGKEQLGQEAILALTRLSEARQSGKTHLMQSGVDIYRQSPKDHFSTAGFNKAMQTVLALEEEDAVTTVLELYEQMISSNCPPNRRTYSYLIRSLCRRDHSQFEVDQDDNPVDISSISNVDYKQALAFVDVVHALPPGFIDVYPYNQILRSSALRGDAEVACAIIDKLSGNKYVTPTAHTFLQLLNAFRRSTVQGNTKQEDGARKLQSCEHVFREFEVFRSSEGWEQDEAKEAKVWNAMISMYIQSRSPHKGIELVQKMIEGEALSEGKKIPPRPTDLTAHIVIRDLVATGDIEGGLNWLENILTLHQGLEENQESIMPLPSAIAINALFKGVISLIPSQQTSNDEITLHLPLVIKANKILNLIYDKLLRLPRESLIKIATMGISNDDWKAMLEVNSNCITMLLKNGKVAEANTLSDLNLSHIKQQFDVYADRLSYSALKEKYSKIPREHLGRIRESVRAILQVVKVLLLQDRIHDAASCYSYAIAASPPSNWHPLSSPLSFDEISEVSFEIMGFRRKKEEAQSPHLVQEFFSLWEIDPEADLRIHTHVALCYVLPATQKRLKLHSAYKVAARDVYLAARQQYEAADLHIDLRGWGYLIDALLPDDFINELNLNFLEVLFNDLAALSEEDRNQLSLQVLISQLPSLLGKEKALEYLQMIRPAVQLDYLKKEENAAPILEAESSSVGSVTEEQSQKSDTDALASSVTTETSLGSPETAREYHDSLSFELPGIVTIDADLGRFLAQEAKFNNQRRVKAARGSKSGREQVNAAKLKPLYERLTRSIREEGIYPTTDGICELMNQFGRIGQVERVKELYLIGCQVVAALGGDTDWQLHAWYDLEDTMTAALAHGGDHRLANSHRLTLLAAGQAPLADTYAALITVIRDTTDDAMVAEELFEESQRYGVTPTLYLYNTVLSKLSRARKTERAMQLFDEMRNRGIQPSSITYGAVLNACTRTGDEANAERFFAMMESDAQFRPQAPPYNTMLQFYTQTKPDRQKALFYYEKACRRNVEHTSHTYKLLLDMYGTIQPVDVEGLRNVFGRLIADYKVEVQGNHWAALIWAHGSHLKDLQKAIEIYNSIPSHPSTMQAGKGGKEPDALAFEALLGVFAEHKRIDLIEEQIRKRDEKGCDLTAYVANVVIKAYATLVPEVGLDRARQVFEKMQDPPMGMAAAGNHPLQRQHVSGVQRENIYQSGVASTSDTQLIGFEKVKREPSTFKAMIQAEMEHGNLEQATALIHRMQARGYPPMVVAHAQDILSQQPQSVPSEG